MASLPPTPAPASLDGGAAFIDGAYVPLSDAKISIFDWGFTRSDATYDVASVWQGAFFRLDDHLQRFFASLATLRLAVPYTPAQVREVLHGCVRAGGLRDAYVAMICTRGVPPKGARDPRLAVNRFHAYAVPFVWIAPPEKQAQGLDLHISARHRIPPGSVDPTVKNYHWLDMVQGLFDGYDQGRDTCVVCDPDGHVTEGPGFNVFAVKDGTVLTPEDGVLHGISRRSAIEGCARLGLPLRRGPLPAAALCTADEVFLTSTGGGVIPVARVDGQPLPAFPGPVTRALQQVYWAMHDEPAHRDPVDFGAPPR